MLQNVILQEAPIPLTRGVKYMRRADLPATVRLQIASIALMFSQRGTIPDLSVRYGVSRTFIYSLSNHLRDNLIPLFGTNIGKLQEKMAYYESIKRILELRLIGRSSLSAISDLLKRQGLKYTSTGFISEILHKIGESLGNLIVWEGCCVWASDEIFFKGHQPILVTVDVASNAILSITKLTSLTKEAWTAHWTALEGQGIKALKLVVDGGNVLESARTDHFAKLPWNPDTFHAVSHRLGIFTDRLERQLEKAKTHQLGRETRFWGLKTLNLQQTIYNEWLEAEKEVLRIRQLLEGFNFLYRCILAQFTLFDTRDATLRERVFAEQEVQTALDYMKDLNINGLAEVIKEVQKLLPHLFAFLDTVKNGLHELEKTIEPTPLPFWKCAWQNAKTAYKIKNYALKQKFFLKMNDELALLQEFYQMEDDPFKAFAFTIFKTLDTLCAHSSAAVENVNSFIRPFLDNSRDQISQEMLNLIIFFFNHRTFTRGKRKGLSPLEILSGKKIDADPIELLLNNFQL